MIYVRPQDAAQEVPGAQVLEGTAPLVVALHPARLGGPGRHPLTSPGLDFRVIPEVAAPFVDCVRPHLLRNVGVPAQQVLTQSLLRLLDVRALEPLMLDLRHRCERFGFAAEPAAHDLLALVACNRQVDHESPAGAIVAGSARIVVPPQLRDT